ncbi:MAG: DUF3568 family protein [Candidatus Methylomirabilales bacterium]|nr:DUF3568 family protein [candidate division NC10 bacterium]
MKQDTKIGLCLGLLAMGLTSCTALGAAATVVGTAFTGASYVQSQTVERTFSAPMPVVKRACHQALKDMAFTIRESEARENTYHIVAVASDSYDLSITITRITANATRVSVNADSLPERDKATGEEIINQMAGLLSPPAPQRFAFPSVTEEETSQLLIDMAPRPPIPLVRTVRPASPQFSTDTSPPPGAKLEWPNGNQDGPQVASLRVEGREETLNLEQIYETGTRDYIQGDFPSATKHFRRYLTAQPDNGQAPKALYWLGESLYSQRQYADALLQYETILRDYPGSPEVPRALFRGAHVYLQLGDTRQAEALLETLITQHPSSREAQLTRATTAGQ